MSVFPNGLGFGYAVMKNAVTIEVANVVPVKPRPISNSKAFQKIREKIAYFEPDTIVVENYRKSYKSKRVSILIQKLIHFTKERGIELFCYSRKDIRFTFKNFGAHTKHEIAQVIVKEVPHLKDRMMKKRRCWEGEGYTTGIFDAVALGITHFYMID